MNLSKRKMKLAPVIPWIALADIAWQVVIFFLVNAAFITGTAIKVDLPSSTKDPQAAKNEPITILAGENYLQVNSKPATMDGLESQIRHLLQGKKTEQERAVLVLGRSDLTFQHDVDIMAAVQRAGGVLVMGEEK
jgi:biopolymer transport protein ExbD